MKDFFKKYNIQSIISIYIVVVFVAFYFLVMPTINEIRDTANKINQEKIAGELREEQLMTVSTMEDNYNKFKENEDSFNIVIDPKNEVELIKELERIAEQTGNKIELKIQEDGDTKPKTKQKAVEGDIKDSLKNSNYLSILIAIEGDHASLINFINKIENYKKTINIISISSEKKEINYENNSNPASVTAAIKTGMENKEVINSIFDVVVYIKK